MRPMRALDGSFNFLGGRIPTLIGILIGLTLGLSILGTFGLAAWGALVPALVWGGEVWRLVTWIFFEIHPVSLIFACLMLWWFGRDLLYAWGLRRFLTLYFGLTATAGVVTCLIARFLWPGLMGAPYIGSWAIAEALIIAWATLFPSRQILIYFIFPLGGRNLIYLTVGTTVLFAIFGGVAAFIPHFVAQGLMLLYLRRPNVSYWWLRLRYAFLTRLPRRRPSHLRPVKRDDWQEPPRWLH